MKRRFTVRPVLAAYGFGSPTSELFEKMMDVLRDDSPRFRRQPEEGPANTLVYEAASKIVENDPDIDISTVRVKVSNEPPRKSYTELKVGTFVVNLNWRLETVSIDNADVDDFEEEASLVDILQEKIFDTLKIQSKYRIDSMEGIAYTLTMEAAEAVLEKYPNPNIATKPNMVYIVKELQDVEVTELVVGPAYVYLDWEDGLVYVDTPPQNYIDLGI